jgi:hypothetical protein
MRRTAYLGTEEGLEKLSAAHVRQDELWIIGLTEPQDRVKEHRTQRTVVE